MEISPCATCCTLCVTLGSDQSPVNVINEVIETERNFRQVQSDSNSSLSRTLGFDQPIHNGDRKPFDVKTNMMLAFLWEY